MPTTQEAAYTAMVTAFETGWNAGTPAIVGSAPPIRIKDVETGDIPKTHFSRLSINTVLEYQSTLRDGELGQRYTVEGNVIVQVFAFKGNDKAVEAAEYARRMAIIARNCFRGVCLPGGIQFRNVRVQDARTEEKFIRRNVVAEFQYDE